MGRVRDWILDNVPRQHHDKFFNIAETHLIKNLNKRRFKSVAEIKQKTTCQYSYASRKTYIEEMIDHDYGAINFYNQEYS